MKGRLRLAVAVSVVAALAVVVTTAIAGGGNDIRERLTGYEEDPTTVSTTGRGDFDARIDESKPADPLRLSYDDLVGRRDPGAHPLRRAPSERRDQRLALLQPGQSPDAPGHAGLSRALRDRHGSDRKRSTSSAPTTRESRHGEFAELVDAMRAGVTYANVHTDEVPGGRDQGPARPRLQARARQRQALT